jgi:hypothetical protein
MTVFSHWGLKKREQMLRKVGCKGGNTHAKVGSKTVSKAIYDAAMLNQIC